MHRSRHRRVASELWLPFDVPVMRQADVEKGRKMSPKDIKVGPFMRIRREPNNARGDPNLRKIICLKCPSMVGGEAFQEKHWTVYSPDLQGALEKAGYHMKHCHTNGSSGDV